MAKSTEFSLFIGTLHFDLWLHQRDRIQFVGRVQLQQPGRFEQLREWLATSTLSSKSQGSVNLFIDSSQILFYRMQISTTGRVHRTAAIYEAEPFFPMPAEESEFAISISDDGQASFMAVQRQWYHELYHELDRQFADHRFLLGLVLPASPLLALTASSSSKFVQSVSITRNQQVEHLTTDGQHIISWSYHHQVTATRTPVLKKQPPSPPVNQPLCDADGACNSESISLRFEDDNKYQLAVLEAFTKLRSKIRAQKLPISFPIPENARIQSNKYSLWEITGLVACLVALIFAGLLTIRGNHYQQLRNNAEIQLNEAVKQVFPDQRVRSPIRALNAELAEKQLQLKIWNDVVSQSDPLDSLLQILKIFPVELNIEISRLDFRQNKAFLQGKTDDLNKISQLAEKLRQAGLIVIETKYALQFEFEIGFPPTDSIVHARVTSP